jgi:hypothetical protein
MRRVNRTLWRGARAIVRGRRVGRYPRKAQNGPAVTDDNLASPTVSPEVAQELD